jgi:hypothetical protein
VRERVAAACLHLLLWAALLQGDWSPLLGALPVRAVWGPSPLGTAALRGVIVQGAVLAWAAALRHALPPIEAWLNPVPWIDVVRVSGMWTPLEPGWRGGWTWALQATAGLCAVFALAAPAVLAGPWLAWTSLQRTPTRAAPLRPHLRALLAWVTLGLAAWTLTHAAAALLDPTTAHRLTRALSWAWLAWTLPLACGVGALPISLALQVGWLSAPPAPPVANLPAAQAR